MDKFDLIREELGLIEQDSEVQKEATSSLPSVTCNDPLVQEIEEFFKQANSAQAAMVADKLSLYHALEILDKEAEIPSALFDFVGQAQVAGYGAEEIIEHLDKQGGIFSEIGGRAKRFLGLGTEGLAMRGAKASELTQRNLEEIPGLFNSHISELTRLNNGPSSHGIWGSIKGLVTGVDPNWAARAAHEKEIETVLRQAHSVSPDMANQYATQLTKDINLNRMVDPSLKQTIADIRKFNTQAKASGAAGPFVPKTNAQRAADAWDKLDPATRKMIMGGGAGLGVGLLAMRGDE